MKSGRQYLEEHIAYIFYSEDVGSTFLQNVGTYQPNYLMSHPRRLTLFEVKPQVR
jgi:hypothetical protein